MHVVFLVLLCSLKHGVHMYVTTPSTGIAASAPGGTTLHCFAGIGIGDENKETLLNNVKEKSHAKNRWLNVKAILIDEI